jgi:hypothetical protein
MTTTITVVLPPSILDGYARGEIDADEIYGAMKYGLERTSGKSVLEIVPGTDFDPPLLGRVVVRWADDERYFHHRVEFVSEADS